MTAKEIDNLPIGATLRDDQVKGLQLRNLNGKKHFYLYYRTKSGVQRNPKIGVYPQDTITDARKRAAEMLGRVYLGEDPSLEMQKRKNEMNLNQLFTKCYNKHWAKKRYQESGWAKNVMQLYNAYLSKEFGNKKLSDISAKDVRLWHADFLIDATYSGNRALNVLVKLFNFAQEMEIVDQGKNPASLVKLHPEKKRGRYATEKELGDILDSLEFYWDEYPGQVAYIYLLLYTGARPKSLEALKKKDIKKEADGWGKISFTGKTGQDTGVDEEILFPPDAMELVFSEINDTAFVTSVKLYQVRYFWKRLCSELGIKGLWLRDLRRTFATIGLAQDVSLDHIGQLLNHKSNQTTLRYAKLISQSRKNAIKIITGAIHDHTNRKFAKKN